MNTWHEALPYFPHSELACKCCGEIKLDIKFAAALPDLRRLWALPLNPSSVCRCPKHNTAEGGKENSLHLTENAKHPVNGTCAIDIKWASWATSTRLDFARFAWGLGWSVGLHNAFVHLDLRTVGGLPQAVFLYGTWSNQFSPDAVKEPRS